MARDRTQIRFDQFAKPKKRRWLWVFPAALLTAIALGAGAWAVLSHANPPTHTPPSLLDATGPSADEAYQWRHVAIGGGGFITGIDADPAGKTFVARTDVYGAYIWDAQADRWMQLISAATMPTETHVQDGMNEGVYEIAVAPSRPDRIYVAIKGRVFRSDNRGQSWAAAGAGTPFPLHWDANGTYRLGGPYMAVDPADADLVVLGTPEAGLWRSADAGASWQQVVTVPLAAPQKPGEMPPGVHVWFERPAGGRPTGRIWAMSPGHGMYVSSDRGAHFVPLPAGGDAPMNLSRGGFDHAGRFVGVDHDSQMVWGYAAGTWHNLSHEAGLPLRPWVAVAADPHGDRVIVMDEGGIGKATADGGRTWTSVAHSATAGAGDPPWLHLANQAFFATADLRFDPTVPDRVWTAAGMGVFRADATGGAAVLAWESQSRGIEELVANDVIQVPGHAPLFGGWDFGVHVKNDLNAWSTTFGPNERFLMSVQQMDWSPADRDFVVTNASDQRTGCCSEDGNAVMAGTSHDDGQTWRKFVSLPTPPGTQDSDPWRMSFGTIAVAADDPKNIVWAPAYNRQPFVTADEGASWQPVVLPGAMNDTPGSFEHPWYQRKTLAADKVAPHTFYLFNSGAPPNVALGGLWRSSDGGKGWASVYPGAIAPGADAAAKLRAVPGHAGHLFFTADNPESTDTGLRRSRDGGESWTVVPAVTRVDDVAFGKAAKGAGYPAIYISGRVNGVYGIWRSVDDAATWQQLTDFPVATLDQVTALGADPDVFGRVYIGYKGSGWVWGEPAHCRPAAPRGTVAETCSRVGG